MDFIWIGRCEMLFLTGFIHISIDPDKIAARDRIIIGLLICLYSYIYIHGRDCDGDEIVDRINRMEYSDVSIILKITINIISMLNDDFIAISTIMSFE